jgi:hypothetical protein
MTDVLVTGADASFGYHAANLAGSILHNSDVFERIEVFDLGLTDHQRGLLRAVPKVVVRDVEPFVPHWAQCRTWKAWAWLQVQADRIFWLDAGATVLRSLEPALDRIAEDGYFLVSQGNELRDILPSDWFALYGVAEQYAASPYVASGIVGFRPESDFYERVVRPTYDDSVAGMTLGFSTAEVAGRNRGLDHMEAPPIRDCRQFRWDQSVLNARLFAAMPDAEVADLDEYAGWRSPRDHPRQVIWSHRRRGSLAYLKRIPFRGPGARRRRLFGARQQLRWWIKLHDAYWRPVTYRLKARALRRRLGGD